MIQTRLAFQLDHNVRSQLYAGAILQTAANEASLVLSEQALNLLCQVLGTRYPASLHEIWAPARLHQAVTRVRRELPQNLELRHSYSRLLTDLGLDLSQWRIDQPRLRAVIPGAERVPAAAPMYYAHRDTWYANPAAQLNLWIPLGDYPAGQTFVFWPEVFTQQVLNDSEQLNYARWKLETGFQNPDPGGGVYPKALNLPESEPVGFACQKGDLLLFSGSQLHQTRPNPGPSIRYSLDLRLVCLTDHHTGLGAPDPDNRSQGSTLSEYLYLGAGA